MKQIVITLTLILMSHITYSGDSTGTSRVEIKPYEAATISPRLNKRSIEDLFTSWTQVYTNCGKIKPSGATKEIARVMDRASSKRTQLILRKNSYEIFGYDQPYCNPNCVNRGSVNLGDHTKGEAISITGKFTLTQNFLGPTLAAAAARGPDEGKMTFVERYGSMDKYKAFSFQFDENFLHLVTIDKKCPDGKRTMVFQKTPVG